MTNGTGTPILEGTPKWARAGIFFGHFDMGSGFPAPVPICVLHAPGTHCSCMNKTVVLLQITMRKLFVCLCARAPCLYNLFCSVL